MQGTRKRGGPGEGALRVWQVGGGGGGGRREGGDQGPGLLLLTSCNVPGLVALRVRQVSGRGGGWGMGRGGGRGAREAGWLQLPTLGDAGTWWR